MSVQVNWMLHKCRSETRSEISQQNTTYRTTKSTTRNGELNALIPLKAVDTT